MLLFGPSLGDMGDNFIDMKLTQQRQRRRWRLAKRRWRAAKRSKARR